MVQVEEPDHGIGGVHARSEVYLECCLIGSNFDKRGLEIFVQPVSAGGEAESEECQKQRQWRAWEMFFHTHRRWFAMARPAQGLIHLRPYSLEGSRYMVWIC